MAQSHTIVKTRCVGIAGWNSALETDLYLGSFSELYQLYRGSFVGDLFPLPQNSRVLWDCERFSGAPEKRKPIWGRFMVP